jgi:recombination protein RecA
MALPAQVLARLATSNIDERSRVLLAKAVAPAQAAAGRSVLPFGLPELDELLPDRGLPGGAVVELAVRGAASLASSLVLGAFRSAQQLALNCGGDAAWCAFIDPSQTLYAPGVAASGVDLEHLLVVRPPLDALGRVALRLAESQAFAVIAIDALGVPGAELNVALGTWARVIRRMAMSIEGTPSSILLVTDANAPRPLPLPVALRLEIARPSDNRLSVRIAKERHGRVSGTRSVGWKTEDSASERAHGILRTRGTGAGHAA